MPNKFLMFPSLNSLVIFFAISRDFAIKRRPVVFLSILWVNLKLSVLERDGRASSMLKLILVPPCTAIP